MVKEDSAPSQLIKNRSLNDRVTVSSGMRPSPIVGDGQKNVGSLGGSFVSLSSTTGHRKNESKKN
jgi:hypothetical protein